MRDKVILLLALIIPCMPKIGINGQVTIYLAEIILFIFSPFLLRYCIAFKVQYIFLYLWTMIAFSTLFSFLYFKVDYASIMRCVKEIIYIPIVYLAYNSVWLKWKHLSYLFIVAVFLNVVYYISSGNGFAISNIWNVDTLFNGFSGKYLDLGSFNILQMVGKGSHSIWGDYCVLSLLCSIIAFETKQINAFVFLLIFYICIFAVSMSVSREGFLCLSSMLFFYLIAKVKSITDNKYFLFLIVVFIAILVIVYFYIQYSDNIALYNKLIYTLNSIDENGTEGNIQLRINGWIVYLITTFNNFYMFLIGYGFNMSNYQSFIDLQVNYSYAPLPESFFVECLMCGGLFSLICCFMLWKNLYSISNSIRNTGIRYATKGFGLGLLFISLFSGASIISDMFYCHFLIFLGLLFRDKTLI